MLTNHVMSTKYLLRHIEREQRKYRDAEALKPEETLVVS